MSETRRNLTLEEIGRLAGVSRSTVSRVLNHHRHVHPEVRARVEAVIAETGYVPNQAARALVSNRTGVIGLVMPTDVAELFGDPYYSALVHGIQQGCLDAELVFTIFPVGGLHDERTVVSALLAQRLVDGLIVTAGPGSDAMIVALRDRGAEMVVVGHPADDRDIRRVDVDNRAGSAAAVAHLVAGGRTRIGFIGPSREYRYAAERHDGFVDGLCAAGLDVDERLVRFAEPTSAGGYDAALDLLNLGAAAASAGQLDAVHVATDTMAGGVLRALAERRRRVPDDVAVVGFDGLPGAPATEPVLTTVVQPVVEVGRTAVEMLDGGRPTAADVVILPTTVRVGATTDRA